MSHRPGITNRPVASITSPLYGLRGHGSNALDSVAVDFNRSALQDLASRHIDDRGIGDGERLRAEGVTRKHKTSGAGQCGKHYRKLDVKVACPVSLTVALTFLSARPVWSQY